MAVDMVLEAYKAGVPQPFRAHPLGAGYLAIVSAVLEAGYTPQRIALAGESARVWATGAGVNLVSLVFKLGAHGWTLQ